jgi:hypothetical protein
VYLAHSVNAFRDKAEWIPVAFSIVAPVLLLPGLIAKARDRGWSKTVGAGVGYAAIAVGVGGLVYHLSDAFFEQQTLKSLVYTAPFAAPLAYTGLGLLLILNRTTDSRTELWARWVLLLALGGFIGNFALSLADHAQNGLFSPLEWIPVVAAAYGAAALLPAAFTRSRRFLVGCLWLQLAQALVGGLGFALHLSADVAHRIALRDHLVYGAPIFAPLLFADLAALASIGLWRRLAVPNDAA